MKSEKLSTLILIEIIIDSTDTSHLLLQLTVISLKIKNTGYIQKLKFALNFYIYLLSGCY